jgi:hypothetical protein
VSSKLVAVLGISKILQGVDSIIHDIAHPFQLVWNVIKDALNSIDLIFETAFKHVVTGVLSALINTSTLDLKASGIEKMFNAAKVPGAIFAIVILIAALVDGAVKGNVQEVIKRMFFVPFVIAITLGGILSIGQGAIEVVNWLSMHMLYGGMSKSALGNAIASFSLALAALVVTGTFTFQALTIVVFLVLALIFLAIWIELAIRGVLLALMFVLIPMTVAGLFWQSTVVWTKRLIELIVAVLLSQLIMYTFLGLAINLQGAGQPVILSLAACVLAAFSLPIALRIAPHTTAAAAHFGGGMGAIQGAASSSSGGFLGGSGGGSSSVGDAAVAGAALAATGGAALGAEAASAGASGITSAVAPSGTGITGGVVPGSKGASGIGTFAGTPRDATWSPVGNSALSGIGDEAVDDSSTPTQGIASATTVPGASSDTESLADDVVAASEAMMGADAVMGKGAARDTDAVIDSDAAVGTDAAMATDAVMGSDTTVGTGAAAASDAMTDTSTDNQESLDEDTARPETEVLAMAEEPLQPKGKIQKTIDNLKEFRENWPDNKALRDKALMMGAKHAIKSGRVGSGVVYGVTAYQAMKNDKRQDDQAVTNTSVTNPPQKIPQAETITTRESIPNVETTRPSGSPTSPKTPSTPPSSPAGSPSSDSSPSNPSSSAPPPGTNLKGRDDPVRKVGKSRKPPNNQGGSK